MSNNPFLYFDIETGDKTPENASILSISHSRGDEKKTLFARPAAPMSDWVVRNVWEPIKQRLGGEPSSSEEEILRDFLGTIQSQKGGTIAGWNVGYVATPMDKGTKGFDIPFIMSRAKKYGLDKDFGEAFGNVNIRDIGRETSVRIAQEVSKHPTLVDPKLYAQAKSFTKLVNINTATQRLNSVPEIAEWMGTPGKYGGYEVAGWKLGTVHEQLFGETFSGAHLSEEDVAATRRIAEQGDFSKLTGPEYIQKWNTAALANKAAASARARGIEGGIGEAFYARAAARTAENRWVGRGIGVIGQHKRAFGIALGIGALLAVKPLQYFSGRDDDWNTIEGLPHRGMAGDTRKKRTDFGSGFTRRSWNVFKTFWNEGNRSISHTVNHLLVPGAKAGKPLELGVLGLTGAEVVHTAMSAMGGTLGPAGIAAAAATFVGSKYAYLAVKKRSQIKAAAQLAKENPLEAKLLTKTAAISSWKQMTDYVFRGRQNEFGTFAKFGGGDAGRQALIGRLESQFGTKFSGADDAFNIIEGLKHGGLAEQLRHKLSDFGSGWVRKALSMGIPAEQVASASTKLGKQMSVIGTNEGSQWVIGKQLGAGGFGSVSEAFQAGTGKAGIYKTSRGAPMNFDPSKGEGVISPAFKHAILDQPDTKFINDYFIPSNQSLKRTIGDEGMTMAHEAKMQRLAHEQYGKIVPEVYGTTPTGFIMESAGRPISEQETVKALNWMKETWGKQIKESSLGSVTHLDPQSANIMKKGDSYMMIDWGVATLEPMSDPAQKAALDVFDGYIRLKQKMVNGHQQAVRQASKNAKYAGKGHTKKAGVMPSVNAPTFKLPRHSPTVKTLINGKLPPKE